MLEKQDSGPFPAEAGGGGEGKDAEGQAVAGPPALLGGGDAQRESRPLRKYSWEKPQV